jgi:hypothetical protein
MLQVIIQNQEVFQEMLQQLNQQQHLLLLLLLQQQVLQEMFRQPKQQHHLRSPLLQQLLQQLQQLLQLQLNFKTSGKHSIQLLEEYLEKIHIENMRSTRPDLLKLEVLVMMEASGGGGRTDGGRGSNGRDAGGRVQYPRGLVQGTNRHSFNASRINRNRAYPWRLISFGPATAESRDLQSNLFKPSSLGAIVPHNNATDLHAVDVATGAALIAGDFDDDEGNEVPIISLFSVLVESTIGQSLINNLQVNRVSSMGDMFRHDFGGGNIDNAQGRDFAESIVSTSPVSVMGHAKMLSGDVIATFNKLGQKEIITRDGQCVINTGYYSGHLEYRGSAGNQLCWIVIGLSLPRNYLHSDQHANHLAGHDALRHLNAAVSGDCRHPTIKCRLYGPYAHIFCRMMEAPIVASARAYHFEPVFFFKNMLLRRNSFENQFELYSCNRGARSSINLVGLSRKAADSPMEFLALKGKNDALATVRG